MITDYWHRQATIERNNFKHKSLSCWSYNIAVGCEHACRFCYVPEASTNRMAGPLAERGVKDPDAEWGNYVFLRQWDERAFRSSLSAAMTTPTDQLNADGNRAIMLCTTTDAYQVIRHAKSERQRELQNHLQIANPQSQIGNCMNLSPEVIQILTTRLTIKGNLVTMPRMTVELYGKVNKALVLMGGKWNRSAKAHVFDSNPTDVIATALGTGTVRDEKKEFQFFPTPSLLAQRMAKLAKIQPGDLVLEPSAGHGALIDAAILFGAKSSQFHLCELNHKAQAVLKSKGYSNIIADDFLTVSPQNYMFDVIIANPPFTRNQDIDHIMHMFNLLNRGGRIVTLASPSWTFGQQKKQVAFREWIDREGFHMEELPSSTFKDTDIRTVLLVITNGQRQPKAERRQSLRTVTVQDNLL